MRLAINCDMGEGTGNDEALMPFIQAANISCGYHAGDTNTIWETVSLALEHDVEIGAHPSFPDKENFGRTEMHIPLHEVYELITQQLIILDEITGSLGAHMKHVKPHGALYNMSAKDPALARIVAQAVLDFNPGLVLFGLSGSHSIQMAKAIGLKTASEVFADRTYQDDGSLTPRSGKNALIRSEREMLAQVLQMRDQATVTSQTGKIIPIIAETVCIHGDGERAVEFAKSLHDAFREN